MAQTMKQCELRARVFTVVGKYVVMGASSERRPQSTRYITTMEASHFEIEPVAKIASTLFDHAEPKSAIPNASM